jgi:putative transposase
VEGKRLFLPKIGWINFRKSRNILGKVKNITLSKQGAHWFASLQVERTLAPPKHRSNSIVGGDLGVKRLLTLSNG